MTSRLHPLRPHQQAALDELRQAISSGYRRPLLQAPTGYGKTVCAAHIVDGVLNKGKRVAFCVPSLSLIDQTFDRFAANGIDPASMGVIQGDHAWRRPHAPVQICSAQTLARRDVPDVDVVIVDEAHLRFKVYDSWMARCGYGPAVPDDEPGNDEVTISRPSRSPIFIGMSATPWSKGLGLYYDRLIKPTSLRDLIEGGYLSPFRVFAPSHPDLTGIKTVAGDYHEGQLGERMRSAELVADVVRTWKDKAKNEPTLCFCVNRAHAQDVATKFGDAGVSTAYVDANTPREERDEIGRRLAARDVQVVVNIGCLTTGVDWDVRCISLCRPTKSKMLFVQIIGRGLRTAEGKSICTILDHSDTHLRLGMVTDIDSDELDDGKPKPKSKAGDDGDEKGPPLPKECKSCAGLIPAGMRECPCCGATSRPDHGVEHVDGELFELPVHVPVQRRKRDRPTPVQQQLIEMGKPAVIGQLYTLRDDWGKTDSWVIANYRDIFGVWPRGLDRAPAVPASSVLRSWLKYKAIAWRNSKGHRTEGRAA